MTALGWHSLNPINESEGGVSLVSPQGEALMRTLLTGDPTILPRQNLLYPGPVGPPLYVMTPRPSIPLVSERWQGPIPIGPANAGYDAGYPRK